MAGILRSSQFREHSLAWAMAGSIALHALLTLMANPFQLAQDILDQPIEVRLLPPPEPEAPPPVIEPPKPPEPTPPPPKPRPIEKPKPLPPKPVEQIRTEPENVVPPPVQPPAVVEQPVTAPPPVVMATEPKPEAPPAYTVPPPPPEPTRPTPQQISSAKGNYGELLARAFAKHKQYPRLAQMRGWQGTTRVRLEIGADGNVIGTSIDESSGHDILDRQALEMVKKATPLPLPPETLREQAFSIIVPITFRLE
jgi:protein TonB